MRRRNIALAILVVVSIVIASFTLVIMYDKLEIREVSALPNRGIILYVGGSGSGNYSSIQDAIDNASNGDTVFVYNGTYFENIIVNKSITLTGENRNGTIIDSNVHGFMIIPVVPSPWGRM